RRLCIPGGGGGSGGGGGGRRSWGRPAGRPLLRRPRVFGLGRRAARGLRGAGARGLCA
ncbi:hypothetical protein P7K49_023171, partial [Saguinus oedipus]